MTNRGIERLYLTRVEAGLPLTRLMVGERRTNTPSAALAASPPFELRLLALDAAVEPYHNSGIADAFGNVLTTSNACAVGTGLRLRGANRVSLALCVVLVVLASPARAGEQDFYLVTDYDPGRDNVDLVTNAMRRAAREDKHVLLILGGDWCGWCKVLENDIDQSEELIDVLGRHYVVAKVHCDSGSPGIRYKPRKQPRYGASFVTIRAKSYPHLVILDSDGNRLLSRNMSGLVENRRYSEEKLLKLLNRHK